MPVRTIAAMVSGLILVNMPFMPSSSPPSSSGRIEIGTRAAVAPSGAPKYLYVTPTRPPFLLRLSTRFSLTASTDVQPEDRPADVHSVGPLGSLCGPCV